MSFFRHGDRDNTFFRNNLGEFPRHSVSTKTQRVNYHKCLFYWLLTTTYSNKISFVFHKIWNYKLYHSTSEIR